jgi:hypothetical protein
VRYHTFSSPVAFFAIFILIHQHSSQQLHK